MLIAVSSLTRAVLVLAFAFFCSLGASSVAFAEEWTSLATNKKVQAAFLGMWQDNVVLRLTDGRRVVVPKNQLTAASRMQAEELAEQKIEARQARIAELSAGPAGNVVAVAEPAADYNPLPESVSLKDFVEAAAKELEAGHLRVIWDSLPDSYQNDVKEVVRLANQTTEEAQYKTNQRLAAQLGRTLLKQRDFVFNYPAMGNVPPEAMGVIEKVYNPAAEIIAIFGDQELMTLEAMRSDDWEPLIRELDKRLAPHLAALIRVVPIEYNPLASLTNLNPNSVQMSGDAKGSVSITNPEGQSSEMVFVLVDGKWLPEPMVANWSDSIASARQQATTAAAQAKQTAAATTAAMSFVGAALGNIESAETQEEFNEIIDMYVGTVMQMVGSQMAASGQGQNGPGMGGAGMSGSGMGAPGMAGPGMSGPGMAGPGMAGPGMSGPGGGHSGPGMKGPGMLGPGMAGPGASGHSGGGFEEDEDN